MCSEIVIEEHRQEWEYVRHTETLRHTIVSGLVVTSGALLAFAFQDIKSVKDLQGDWRSSLVLTSLLGLWVLALCFLISQKRNYNRYVARIRARMGRTHRTGPFGPFGAYFTACAFATAVLAALLSYAAEMTNSQSDSILVGVVVFIVAMILLRVFVGETKQKDAEGTTLDE